MIVITRGGDVARLEIRLPVNADLAGSATVRYVWVCHRADAAGRVAGFEIAGAGRTELGFVEAQASGGIGPGRDRALIFYAIGIGLELRAGGIAVHTLVGGEIAVAIGVVDIAARVATAGEGITDLWAPIGRPVTTHGVGTDAVPGAVTRRGLCAGVGVGTRGPCGRKLTTARTAATVPWRTGPIADARAKRRVPRAVAPIGTLLAVVALFPSVNVAVAALGLVEEEIRTGPVLRIAHGRRRAGQRLIAAAIAAPVAEVELGTAVPVVARRVGGFEGAGRRATVRAARRAGAAANPGTDGGIVGTVGETILALFAVVTLFANIGEAVAANRGP